MKWTKPICSICRGFKIEKWYVHKLKKTARKKNYHLKAMCDNSKAYDFYLCVFGARVVFFSRSSHNFTRHLLIHIRLHSTHIPIPLATMLARCVVVNFFSSSMWFWFQYTVPCIIIIYSHNEIIVYINFQSATSRAKKSGECKNQ